MADETTKLVEENIVADEGVDTEESSDSEHEPTGEAVDSDIVGAVVGVNISDTEESPDSERAVDTEESEDSERKPVAEVYRPYSLDPKLNKMIEAFVRGMNNSRANLILAHKAVKAKMMKRVYKIMDMFKRRKNIKNDDVEKFLHVSDDTATKYLNILVKEGKVKREGNSHSPSYKEVE